MVRLQKTDGVSDHGEILNGIDINSGEPKCSQVEKKKKNYEYATTSFNRQGIAKSILAV